MAFYSNPTSTTFSLSKLPTEGLKWGNRGNGADDLSSVLTLNGQPVTVLILGEMLQSFLTSWNGGSIARAGVVVRPMVQADCDRGQEIVTRFASSAHGEFQLMIVFIFVLTSSQSVSLMCKGKA